ncbi:MAG TPA: hypothetical protein VD886_00385 [Herpetosiphonaceae bacterium]|nr:hypothetical protein [Herpetosiphonaceae bacterium]
MFRVPEDHLVSRWTIFNHMTAVSLRGAATAGALIGGGYGGFIGLCLHGPLIAGAGGFAGGMLGWLLGIGLGLVNGLLCVIATIVAARPLRSPHAHQRLMYGISSLNFGTFTLLGLDRSSIGDGVGVGNSSAAFLLFTAIPAVLAALAGLWVGHGIADWYARRIRAEERERRRGRPVSAMLDARPPQFPE